MQEMTTETLPVHRDVWLSARMRRAALLTWKVAQLQKPHQPHQQRSSLGSTNLESESLWLQAAFVHHVTSRIRHVVWQSCCTMRASFWQSHWLNAHVGVAVVLVQCVCWYGTRAGSMRKLVSQSCWFDAHGAVPPQSQVFRSVGLVRKRVNS